MRKIYEKLNERTVKVRLRHPKFGMAIGSVVALSASGIFITGVSNEDFSPSMIVEVDLLGPDWDSDPPSLSYEVIRVDHQGVRLKVNNDVFNANTELDMLNSA